MLLSVCNLVGFPVDKTRLINELTKTVEEKDLEINKLKDDISSVTVSYCF